MASSITSMNREAVFKLLDEERKRQAERWGEPDNSIADWILIMERCINKAKLALADNNNAAMQEIYQATAVGVAAIEQHGARQCKLF